MTEDEMVGLHHRLNGLEFEQAPGDGEGQGSLECCSPWGWKELDVITQLNNNKKDIFVHLRSNFQLIACWVPCEELMRLKKEK